MVFKSPCGLIANGPFPLNTFERRRLPGQLGAWGYFKPNGSSYTTLITSHESVTHNRLDNIGMKVPGMNNADTYNITFRDREACPCREQPEINDKNVQHDQSDYQVFMCANS